MHAHCCCDGLSETIEAIDLIKPIQFRVLSLAQLLLRKSSQLQKLKIVFRPLLLQQYCPCFVSFFSFFARNILDTI